eukprot:TRINITY_DN14093_c0_g1_i1.p1 TRINITY_DN14093_c0_g1~~TRINITY_DN14093_c0_g1_i1.p1  ORF type:complete len:184 (-),score=46.39 TRINITY_DN14093_c0_g1_i1:179-730(-)
MGKSNQLPTKAKRTKDAAAREEKKTRVKPREPHGNASGPGAHLELPEDLLKKHESSLTDFKMQVYALTQKIPAGKVTTYGAMAEVLGSSPRAVGGALRNNPFAPTVPCHRIVAASGAMNGFSGETAGPQIDKKANLLKSEGVKLTFTSGDARVETSFVLSKEDLRNLAGDAFPTKSPKKSPKK